MNEQRPSQQVIVTASPAKNMSLSARAALLTLTRSESEVAQLGIVLSEATVTITQSIATDRISLDV
jgi:hypothetical protein